MASLGDLKVTRLFEHAAFDIKPDVATILIEIPMSVVDQFSYGMIHDRIRHATGVGLQHILLERRAELLGDPDD